MKLHDEWGTVCHFYWDMSDAAVVCRQLGCGVALEALHKAHFGPGSGPIWMVAVACNGKESALSDCNHAGRGESYCSHNLDAGVICSEYTAFRLVNGSTACEGRVEVEVLGTWGTLCASRWDLSDAHVLCRHLGCGFAESIPGGGHFGRGTGPVWRDSFHCDGTEGHLGQCPVTALGASPCSQENAAAVICSGPAHHMSIRLVGGGSRCDGLVEVFQHGTWGRVLGEQWDMQEASVVCWQLQCGEAETAYTPVRAERGSRRVRLVDGAGRCAGRVEIYYQGRWGTVCDNAWDLADAAVVCHQLGCGGALEAAGSARFGEGSGQIWLDGVNCSGAEAALWDCPAEAWGQHSCGHKEDAGVICSEFMALRLENSDGCSGRLQVFYNGTWGSVCSNSMTTETVSLVCKELGCGNEGELETDSNSAKLSGITWLDHVECGKSNSSFWQCPSDPWHLQSCDDLREETHITCNGTAEVRLADGGRRCAGRVEVKHRGQWGTVCSDHWDMTDAAVVCRQLGCGVALEAPQKAHFGPGSGSIWMDDVHCNGNESALSDCTHNGWGQTDCDHSLDAGVTCSGFVRLVGGDSPCSGSLEVYDRDQWKAVCHSHFGAKAAEVVCRELQWSRRVRLVDGAGRCAGRVEIYYQGRWGTVCDNAWDLADAAVVCHQLGCGGALEAAGSARFGEGSGQIWLDGVNCSGAEAALWDCPAEAWGQHDCGHKEDVGVICSEFMALRLENSDGCSGRLQVFYNGTWGSVCSNSMTTETVSLVCKELGCGNEEDWEIILNSAKLSGITWLDHVECGKSNSSFWQCPSDPWHPQSCTDRREETHITCNGKSQPSRHQVLFPTGHGEMQRRNPEGL
ncbi:antigen WC1.1-like [Anas platyrhynchos]|uniref:antigen WC1.1-like n=1 Tax=Anas platyrhynchos TaxID=8839 RepID=UPI003AF2F1B6